MIEIELNEKNKKLKHVQAFSLHLHVLITILQVYLHMFYSHVAHSCRFI